MDIFSLAYAEALSRFLGSTDYYAPSGLASIRADIAEALSSMRAYSTGRAKTAYGDALTALPSRPKLLGTSTKIAKNEKQGYLAAVVYMSPSRESGIFDLCPNATSACRAACLGSKAGRMIMTPNRAARLWKTAALAAAPEAWFALLFREIQALERKAKKAGLTPAVRIDGSTDTGIGALVANSFPNVQFWDYTKSFDRAMAAIDAPRDNFSITFSGHSKNASEYREILSRGGNVAMVFAIRPGEALPKHLNGTPIIDGDLTDARMTDPKGVIVGLRFKAAKDWPSAVRNAIRGGFVLAEGPMGWGWQG